MILAWEIIFYDETTITILKTNKYFNSHSKKRYRSFLHRDAILIYYQYIPIILIHGDILQ